MKTIFFIAMASISIFACSVVGCGVVRSPSCGEWRTRIMDGATCRECVDRSGTFAQCHHGVMR